MTNKSTTRAKKKKLLVVGGAGYVASIINPALEDAYDCYYFDRKPVPGRAGRTTIGDVLDLKKVRRAVRGKDAILYAAMGTLGIKISPTGHRTDIHDVALAFGVNAGGWYAFMLAGVEEGVRQFVYTSTLSVYAPELEKKAFDESKPCNAWHPYGISKRAGELVCAAAAQSCPEATILALRIFGPRNEEAFVKHLTTREPAKTPFLAPNDTRRLFLAALACKKRGAHFVIASGDRVKRYYDQSLAKKLLGWVPEGR